MIPCPGCGSQMTLDPATQKLTCGHCGRTIEPDEAASVSAAKLLKETSPDPSPAENTYETHVYRCPSCGAELLSTDETVATFCNYCGNAVLLEERISKEESPDCVIPFQVTKEQCEEAYRKLLRRALYVPSEMKQDTQIERFRGIYMPYWIYSFEKNGSYSVQGSTSRRRGDYVYTKHYQLKSHMDAACKGLSYDASSKFADNLSGAIAPFHTKEMIPFSPAYFSGFYADRGDVDSYVYRQNASDMAKEYIADQVSQARPYRKYHVSESSLRNGFRPKHSEARLGMFPVWFLGCRSHDGERISYAVVNGQTGKIAADLPIDLKKYLLGSAVLAIPLFFLLNLFLTLTPTKALLFAMGLALLTAWFSNRQLNQIYTRDLQLDDLGLQSVAKPQPSHPSKKTAFSRSRKKSSPTSGIGAMFLRVFGIFALMWGSMALMGIFFALGMFSSPASILIFVGLWVFLLFYGIKKIVGFGSPGASSRRKQVFAPPMKEKWPTLYKPLLAVLIALLILAWDPVEDIYYYIGAAAAFGCVIWSFFDIIKEHNLLTTRKLPQMEKRGGDERA